MNRSHPDGRRSWRHLVFWATCPLGLVHVSVAWAGQATSAPDPATRQRIAEQYGKLPLSFIQNRGQVPEPIEWYVQRPALHLAFTPQGQQIILRQGQGESAKTQRIDIDLVEAKPRAIETLIPAEGIVSYFKGPKEHWKTGVPTAEAIVYRSAYVIGSTGSD